MNIHKRKKYIPNQYCGTGYQWRAQIVGIIGHLPIQPAALAHQFPRLLVGRASTPLGRLDLEVVFEDKENFRSETIQFEVAPFRTGYNATLRRLAYVKFMALPSYVRDLQLKMLGPNGTITIHYSPKTALETKVACVELAEAALASAELKHIKKSVYTSTTTLPTKLGRVRSSNWQRKPKNFKCTQRT